MKNIAVTILGFILNFLVLIVRAKSAKDWHYDPILYNYDAFIWFLTCMVGAAIVVALIPDLSGNGIFDTRNELPIWRYIRASLLVILAYCLIQAILVFIPLYNHHIIRGYDIFDGEHSKLLILANYIIYLCTVFLSCCAIFFLVKDLQARQNLPELVVNLPLFLVNVSYSYVMDLHVDGETDWYPIFDYLQYRDGKLKFIKIQTNYEKALMDRDDVQKIYISNSQRFEHKRELNRMMRRSKNKLS